MQNINGANKDGLLEIQMHLNGISNMLVVIEASKYYNEEDKIMSNRMVIFDTTSMLFVISKSWYSAINLLNLWWLPF